MKRMVWLLVLAVLLCTLAGCCLKHQWEPATCEHAGICAKCGKTQGSALDHEWAEATCAAPTTCERCGKTRGEALSHRWVDASCTRPRHCEGCGAAEGESLGHRLTHGTLVDGQLSGYCSKCGLDIQEPVSDWGALGRASLVGVWDATLMTEGTHRAQAPGDCRLEFREDGGFLHVWKGKETKGSWNFDFHEMGEQPCLFYTATLDGQYYAIVLFDEDLSALYLVKGEQVTLYEKR